MNLATKRVAQAPSNAHNASPVPSRDLSIAHPCFIL
jgi:hypothetical protein